MTGPVDAVLFDLDDTLCEYHRGGDELLSSAFEDVGVEPFFTVEDYHARYSAFVSDTEDIRELRAECFAAIARDRGRDPEVGRAVADAFSTERDHRAVRLFPGAKAAGVRAAWFTGGEVGGGTDPDPAPDYRLDSLRELLEPPWREV
jgi:FMN phosphatase YigB (HAD superfamily)